MVEHTLTLGVVLGRVCRFKDCDARLAILLESSIEGFAALVHVKVDEPMLYQYVHRWHFATSLPSPFVVLIDLTMAFPALWPRVEMFASKVRCRIVVSFILFEVATMFAIFQEVLVSGLFETYECFDHGTMSRGLMTSKFMVAFVPLTTFGALIALELLTNMSRCGYLCDGHLLAACRRLATHGLADGI